MDNKEKLLMLAMRAFEKVQLDMEDEFSYTLAMMLQKKLEAPEAPLRPILLKSFEAEEPLAWDEWPIPELKVVVLNDKRNKQLHFIDDEIGDKLLVLPRKELKDE